MPGDTRYNQKNAYAGGTLGEMGGFENKPAVIDSADMWYQEVGRAIYDDMEGIDNSIPDGIKAGLPVTHSYHVSLPDNVLMKENTELVVLLLNNPTGEILNACKVDTGELYRQTGVTPDTMDDTPQVTYDSVGNIVVESGCEIAKVTVYDITGKILADLSPKSTTATINTKAVKGVKIVKIETQSGLYTKKVL